MKRAVFLDRDGVLNDAVVRDGLPYPPASVNEMTIATGAPVALAQLKARGFMLCVVSNQPDVARGTQTEAEVTAINDALAAVLPIDAFYMCFHDSADKCDCRKPLPGLMQRAARAHGISLPESYLVGDRWRDVDAGARAGCTTVLIDFGYTERKPEQPPDIVVDSILAAAQAIVAHEENSTSEA